MHCDEHRYTKQIYRVLLADANNWKLKWVSQVKQALHAYSMATSSICKPQCIILEMTH